MSTKSRVNKRKRLKPLPCKPPLPTLDPPSKKRRISSNNTNSNKNSKEPTQPQQQQNIDRKNNENSDQKAPSSSTVIPNTSNSSPIRSSAEKKNEEDYNSGHSLGALMSGRKPGLFLRRNEVMSQLQEMAKSGAIPKDLQKQMDEYKARMNAKRTNNKRGDVTLDIDEMKRNVNGNNIRKQSDNSQRNPSTNQDNVRINNNHNNNHNHNNDRNDRIGVQHANQIQYANQNMINPINNYNYNHNRNRNRNRNRNNRNNRNVSRLPPSYQAMPRPKCQRIVVVKLNYQHKYFFVSI